MSVVSKAIRAALEQTAELDQQWLGKVPGAGDARHTPWMPFPVPEYITLLAQAVSAADGDMFLEVGCGIGTRMLLARTIFGLDVAGFERTPEYVHQARELQLRVWEADAANWAAYSTYDIIWFNRVFRDAAAQAELETRVWDAARPGAVVMCANLEDRPPSRWLIVEDDWEVRRGVWRKPLHS